MDREKMLEWLRRQEDFYREKIETHERVLASCHEDLVTVQKLIKEISGETS